MSTTNQAAPETEETPEVAPMDDWTLLRDVIWPQRPSSISKSVRQ